VRSSYDFQTSGWCLVSEPGSDLFGERGKTRSLAASSNKRREKLFAVRVTADSAITYIRIGHRLGLCVARTGAVWLSPLLSDTLIRV
jgi:hypothetical protein